MKLKDLNKRLKAILEKVQPVSALNHAFLQQKEPPEYKKVSKQEDKELFELTLLFTKEFKDKGVELNASKIKKELESMDKNWDATRIDFLVSKLIEVLKLDTPNKNKQGLGAYTDHEGKARFEVYA